MISFNTCIRLYPSEIKLINRGIGFIQHHASELHLWEHDAGLDGRIRNVSRVFSEVAQRSAAKTTHRVYLDALGIAISMFAVRLFTKEFGEGRVSKSELPWSVDCKRLLSKLEKHRKRAKRKWLRTDACLTYKTWHQRWRRFLDWVRENRRPIRVPTLSEFYRRGLDRVVATVKRVLIEETNMDLPDERDLRKLVRIMCRHVRRERAPVTMKDIIICSSRGRAFIASYLVRLIARFHDENPSAAPVEVSLPSPPSC